MLRNIRHSGKSLAAISNRDWQPIQQKPKICNPLLRFKTNLNPETWSSLEEYVSRMKDGQKEIYYIVGDDPKSVLRSPHLDYFHSQGTEVSAVDRTDGFVHADGLAQVQRL